ncbi:hypothetical protein RRG08_035402 [Elysia crispata]|uniref:Transposase n=1 Tax=Elysia crispata TaxID=231223 RepID=A0AAE0Y3W8_9GAST|nr:hypothetical protein RRG08_035402 [Elysia crispata]
MKVTNQVGRGGEGSGRNFLRRFQTEQNDFLDRIITGDETWVYSWDPETKRQSAEWRDFDEPRPEKVRRKQGALKVMHMIFFYMNGVILRWPVPIGTTINAQYYKKVLQDKLRPAIRKKRPGLLESGILFHHDNAPVHTAWAVTDVLAGYKWELLEHPRYSPDLAPLLQYSDGDLLCWCVYISSAVCLFQYLHTDSSAVLYDIVIFINYKNSCEFKPIDKNLKLKVHVDTCP